MSDPTPPRPDEGAYTDEETPDGRSTHRDTTEPGQYDDAETPEGTRTAHGEDRPGEYTDVDETGER